MNRMRRDELNIGCAIHHVSRGGGVSSQLMKMARIAHSLGHRVLVGTLGTEVSDPTSNQLREYAHVETGPAISPFNPLAPIRLGQVILDIWDKQEFDLLQLYDPIIAGMASLWAKKKIPETPIVVRLGTNYPAHFDFQFKQTETNNIFSKIEIALKTGIVVSALKVIENICLGYFDSIVANCDYLKSIYTRRISDAGKIVVIRNGVDITRFKPHGSKYPLPRDKLWLLYLGRIEKRKGLHVLLNALPRLFERYEELELLIVGRAPRQRYHSYLRHLSRVLDIDSRIHYLGPIGNEDVPEIMRAVDAFVLPSDTGSLQVEGLPNVVLEAMACGLPVVASNICGIPEAIKHGKTGFLAAPGSTTDFADQLDTVFSSENIRAELGEEARNFICDDFSLKRSVQRYIRLYYQLLEDRA